MGVDQAASETVDLLRALIRNRCVNDGTKESGQEVRNADTIAAFLGTTGFDVDRYEPAPGRTSLVARIEGSDPNAPSLCLMGHTDVVPVHLDGWSRDPFEAELVDGGVWGRGAIDMLNITASMAVAFRQLAATGFRPSGDLIYLAVADEEAGSAWGARWLADNEPDAIRADYVLTENGGVHAGTEDTPCIGMTVGEKGVAWRRLTLRGTPGHGSMPFGADNALVKAAAVVQRLAEYRPSPVFTELWRERVDTLGFDEETTATLLDPSAIDGFLDAVGKPAAYLHACTHTTFSPNVIGEGPSGSRHKTNVIPGQVQIEVDVRTLPGETADDVQAHLRAALGDLADEVEVEALMDDPATTSQTGTPLWDSLQKAVNVHFPAARLSPQMAVGFTDSRVFREMGSIAYGAALLDPSIDAGEFGRRFHGNDERVDVESLRLTTQLWLDTITDLLG